MRSFKITKKNLLICLFFVIIVYIPLFYNLTKPAIYIWDEAIYANNALEMAINKDFWVLKNNDVATLYNVKPPFVIWLQCLAIWIFGANEFAIRLPSVLAALFTCIVVFYFVYKNFNAQSAFFALAVLVTSQGYIKVHVTRTGDLDSVLVFFITAYSLLIFNIILNKIENYRRYFLILGLLVFCAFLSKSVAGFLPLLGIATGLCFFEHGRKILLDKYSYLTGFLVLFGCVSFYLFREFKQPNYFQKVWFSEYSRFTQNIMPWHEQPFFYYLQNFANRFFKYFIYLLPFVSILFVSKNFKMKSISILGIIFCLSYFLLISYPSVKLEWYDAPLYPIFSILIAILFNAFFDLFFEKLSHSKIKFGFSLVIGFIIFYKPYFEIYKQNQTYLPFDNLEQDGYAIRELSKTNPELHNYKVLLIPEHPEHLDQANFYIKKLNYFENFKIQLVSKIDKIELNDYVLCSQSENIDILKSKYKTVEIASINKSKLFKIQ